MIVYGKQIVFHILDKHPEIINEIFLTKEIEKSLFNKFNQLKKKIVRPDNMKAQALARGGNHQGFLLDIQEYRYATLSEIKGYNFIVVLDGLTDVGNIGAIVRSAYALGVDAVVVCGLKNLNSAAITRTSSGAILDIPVVLYQNSADVLNELKQVGCQLIGASTDGMEVGEYVKSSTSNKIVLCLGSEGSGLSKKVMTKLDTKVKIKMSNDFDSLNVSVAAGILIHSLKSIA